jgi:hypothetical protein
LRVMEPDDWHAGLADHALHLCGPAGMSGFSTDCGLGNRFYWKSLPWGAFRVVTGLVHMGCVSLG